MGVISMFSFSIVKKIGEGKYLSKDNFILERIRRERALNIRYMKVHSNKRKVKPFTRDERFNSA